MDRHELDRMFDGLKPGPGREQALLRQLLQEQARRNRPMKQWKSAVLAAVAAVLLVTAAAAAAVPGLSQKLLAYLGVAPEDAHTAQLLAPGAVAVDIVKEDNGATLHVTQVLRDRHCVLVLAELTAPEGTQLYMGEPDPTGQNTMKGLNGTGGMVFPDFLDEDGEKLDVTAYSHWRMVDDEDPWDNRVTLMFTFAPNSAQKAASLWVPARDLAYFDMEKQAVVPVYSGDWSFEVPLPQGEIGWTLKADRAVGELDGADIYLEELYLSPMTLAVSLRREGGIDFGAPIDEENAEENEAMYSRWLSIGNAKQLILTTRDGETIPLEGTSGTIGIEDKILMNRLTQIADPAQFQGGALTLEWDFTHNSQEAGSFTLKLDDLRPVEP